MVPWFLLSMVDQVYVVKAVIANERARARMMSNGIPTSQLDMIPIGALRECPCCNTMITKDGGCPRMHCTACNNLFIWELSNIVTAERWMDPNAFASARLATPASLHRQLC